MQIRVVATPNAKSNVVLGWQDDPRAGRVLRVRVAEAPVDGRANSAVAALLAAHFNVPKTTVRLAKGATSRVKTFELPAGTSLGDGHG